jgi:hypothetical protein
VSGRGDETGPEGAASANARPSQCEEASSADALRPQGDGEADILAYLRRRRANAATVAEAMRGRDYGGALDGMIEDRRRQLEVIIAEIEAGFHHGEAQVAADLAARQAEIG